MTVRDDEGFLVVDDFRRFETASQSQPGVTRRLVARAVDGKIMSCSCPAWSYKQRCRHAARLAIYLDEFQEVRTI